MILGLDTAPRKCGWCVGDGSIVPTAGGFRLRSEMCDLGELLEEMKVRLDPILDRYRPEVVIYESPILPGNRRKGDDGPVVGSVEQRRAQFSQGAFVEWLCLKRGIICVEADPFEVKMALTGSKRPGRTSQEQKDAMVAQALKLGVSLPAAKVDGREDAADAVGAWLVGVRNYAKPFLAAWDRRVFSPRGALL